MADCSLRKDYYGVARRLTQRGGNISAREFKASFPIGVELLNRENASAIVIHEGRKSEGAPLVALVPVHSTHIGNIREKSCSLADLRDSVDCIAVALREGDFDAIPVRKMFGSTDGPIVAYAMRPQGLGAGQST